MEAITIHLKSKEDLDLLKQLASRLQAPFETKKENIERGKAIKKYGKDFVEKIEASTKTLKRENSK